MGRRALLIGSQAFGLTGVEADVRLMAAALGERGFDVTACTGADATRDGIVDALDQLVAATVAGDAVVIYYSGHGGRLPWPDWAARQAAGLRSYMQFLVPRDIDASTDERFLGVLSEELSAYQWQLTDRTANVTTILDCCHAGTMARDFALRPKAVARPVPFAGALARLVGVPARATGRSDSNPDAVRIVACGAEQSAYEGPSVDGRGHQGLLTAAVVAALHQVGDRRLSWAVLTKDIRHRISTTVTQQRPEAEGPSRRCPFSLDEAPEVEGMAVVQSDGRRVVEAGALLGLQAGDELELVSQGQVVGVARVSGLSGGDAVVDPTAACLAALEGGDPAVAAGLRARAVRLNAPRTLVAIAVPGAMGEKLGHQIRASPRLAVAENLGDGDGSSRPGVLGVAAVPGGIAVFDPLGAPMRRQNLPLDDSGANAAVDLLELAAAAHRLATMDSGSLADPFEVTLLVDHGGGEQPVPRAGARLHVGDRARVRVRNLGTRELYLWFFDIGVSRRISLVTQGEPSGVRLEPAGEAGDTRTIWGERSAVLEWPDDVPDDVERDETFVVLVADRPVDLRGLERRDHPTRSWRAPLPGPLAEVASGSREVRPEADAAWHYRVEPVDLFLVPHARTRVYEATS